MLLVNRTFLKVHSTSKLNSKLEEGPSVMLPNMIQAQMIQRDTHKKEVLSLSHTENNEINGLPHQHDTITVSVKQLKLRRCWVMQQDNDPNQKPQKRKLNLFVPLITHRASVNECTSCYCFICMNCYFHIMHYTIKMCLSMRIN